MENNESQQVLIAGGFIVALLLIAGMTLFTPGRTSDVLGVSANRSQGMVQLIPVEEIPGASYSPRQ